jgi:ECF transporter S component (folate family)
MDDLEKKVVQQEIAPLNSASENGYDILKPRSAEQREDAVFSYTADNAAAERDGNGEGINSTDVGEPQGDTVYYDDTADGEVPAKTVYTREKRRLTTQTIAYLAVLTALAVVVKRFSIDLGPNSKVSFLYLPVYLAGALFGPLGGALVAGIGDALGSTLQYGSPDPAVLGGNTLMGLIMGFTFRIPKLSPVVKITLGAVTALLVCSLGINTVATATTAILYSGGPNGATGVLLLEGGRFTIVSWWRALVIPYGGALLPRIVVQPIMIALNLGLAIPIYGALKNSMKIKPVLARVKKEEASPQV